MQRQKRLYPSGLELVAILLCCLYEIELIAIGVFYSWYLPFTVTIALCSGVLVVGFATILLGARRVAEAVQWFLTLCMGLLSLYCLAATESCYRQSPGYRDLWPIGLFVGLACFGLAVVHSFIARHLRHRED